MTQDPELGSKSSCELHSLEQTKLAEYPSQVPAEQNFMSHFILTR